MLADFQICISKYLSNTEAELKKSVSFRKRVYIFTENEKLYDEKKA